MNIKLLDSKVVYQNSRIKILMDTLKYPDGRVSQYTYYKGRDGVVILPLRENGNIIMIRQYRYLVGEMCLELPAGGIEEGETPLCASQRELIEETGFCAVDWEKKLEFYPSNGISAEKVHVYFAKSLEFSGKTASDEETDVVEIERHLIRDLILSGKILGASSLIALNLLLLEENASNGN